MVLALLPTWKGTQMEDKERVVGMRPHAICPIYLRLTLTQHALPWTRAESYVYCKVFQKESVYFMIAIL